MRTHVFNKMTADEVESYLASGRNAIFIPVGVTEIHGEAPVDIEGVYAEAYALAMAEQSDAVALMSLPYFYPGGTAIGEATVHTSIFDGIEYLFQICRSLVGQGFRKLFLVPGHSAHMLIINPFIRDFFEETGIHPVAIGLGFGSSLQMVLPPEATSMHERDKFVAPGAYKMLHQLQYLPVDPDVQEQRGTIIENDPALRNFADRVRPLGSVAALAFSDKLQHGGGYVFRSEEERAHYAEIGEKIIRDTFRQIDFDQVFRLVDAYQDYVEKVVKVRFPRFGNLG